MKDEHIKTLQEVTEIVRENNSILYNQITKIHAILDYYKIPTELPADERLELFIQKILKEK